MSDESVQLSLKLWDILERIGVSERMRKLYRDASFQVEIVATLIYQMTDNSTSTYRFGSTCEGTTTPGMGSDFDTLYCEEHIPVIEDIQDAPSGPSYLMVKDNHTRPGYVKLQILMDGKPLNKDNSFRAIKTPDSYDCNGRLCMKPNTTLGKAFCTTRRNGPEDTAVENYLTPGEDYVKALRCRTFPLMATKAMEKCITCGWMSRDDIEKIKQFGCLLVGVGHPSSEEADFEWQVSFPLQERQLMLGLNETQHACYVLLKLVKLFITQQLKREEKDNFITSYHCKTCLFSVITHTSPALWTSENLIRCTYLCLCQLKHWIYTGSFPNFFINDNNMFDRQAFVDVQELLLHHLRGILHQWPNIFYQIETDHIGAALRGTRSPDKDQKMSKPIDGLLMCVDNLTWLCQLIFLKHCKQLQTIPQMHIPQQTIVKILNEQLKYLQSVDTVNEHSREDTQTAVQRVQYILHKLMTMDLSSYEFESCSSDPDCAIV